MAQLATIAPILQAVSSGIGTISGIAKGDWGKALSSAGGLSSLSSGKSGSTSNSSDYSLGGYGNRLSLSDSMSSGSNSLAGLGAGSVSSTRPSNTGMSQNSGFASEFNNPFNRARR